MTTQSTPYPTSADHPDLAVAPSPVARPAGKRARPGAASFKRAAGVGLLLSCTACSQFSVPFHIPFTRSKAPDLTPSRASAENIIRLDAATRSGCEEVNNIERPDDAAANDPRNPAPQRWIARTCNGDISYDVVTTPGPNGPTVSVTAVPGPLNRPINPHFQPAMPEEPAK